MKTFISFCENFRKLLPLIVNSHQKHIKWLNTLSFLENSGARKIAACQHPTLVKEEMLKHAAEEFRHAFYLKRQIAKVLPVSLENYALDNLIGGVKTLHYLSLLDHLTSRYLLKQGYSRSSIKEMSYYLVTYAIEKRAEELYPIYHGVLKSFGSKVTVSSILLEEKEHLQEMEEKLKLMPNGYNHAEIVCAYESQICEKWLDILTEEVFRD